VPAHDSRDYEFAKAFDLPVRRVIEGVEEELARDGEGLPYPGDGAMVASGRFDGKGNREAYAEIVEWLAAEGRGEPSVNYRLRDWLVSRQRYWGAPIPIVYCEKCGTVPVPDDLLPVELPEIDDYAPKGKSPLAAAEDWVATECPGCGGPARRETDTMDTFVDSSWYFIRYLDPRGEQRPWDRAAADHWLPVDQYIGGVEHAILHLMYARFVTKALADLGELEVQEPFANLFAQGMITRDGAKMSKSRGTLWRRPSTSSATAPTLPAPMSASWARPSAGETGPTRASRASGAFWRAFGGSARRSRRGRAASVRRPGPRRSPRSGT